MKDDSAKKEPHVHFDEKQIAEHDKDRGTRQTIDEPKTPFEKSVKPVIDDDGNTIDFEALTEKLDSLNANESKSDIEKRIEAHNFEEKRKKHYNEFTEMKKFLATHNSLDEDDDE